MTDLSNWQKYTGQYVKAYMDVQLKDGSVIERTWPNAGTFYDATGKRTIEASRVAQVRRSADQAPSMRFARSGRFRRGRS